MVPYVCKTAKRRTGAIRPALLLMDVYVGVQVEGLVGEVTNARVMSRLLLFADVHPLNRPPPSIHNNKNDECGGAFQYIHIF